MHLYFARSRQPRKQGNKKNKDKHIAREITEYQQRHYAYTRQYINLYSPTSGSKDKKTYIHINTVKNQQKIRTIRQKNRTVPLVAEDLHTEERGLNNIGQLPAGPVHTYLR